MASYDTKAIRAFIKRWEGRGYEKGETAKFWEDLQKVWGYPHSETTLYEHHLANGGFIDVWLREGDIIVEQKSLDVDLDKPEPRQGKMKTPLDQALDYVDELKQTDQPRYVMTCNFETFRIYDRQAYMRSQLAGHAFEFRLCELAKHPEYLAIVTEPANARLEKEKDVSIKAGDLIGQLYDRLAARYVDATTPESMHALNVLCVRIVFCLFCEDADLFERDAFYNYLNGVPASYLRSALRKLFRVLDTPIAERDPYDVEDMPKFPYVNGGLFRGEIEIPNFDEDTKRFLLDEISAGVDWSEISPTIFGGIFESTLNPETRRKGGMHYTSPENIHKVIDPLFLDRLKAEYAAIRDDVAISERTRKMRYRKLHRKICGLTFFDPACGSGNFLTETYLCLRRLEDAILRESGTGQAQMVGLGMDSVDEPVQRISLDQFYGIEINDFAVTVAEAALWISKLKANGQTMMMLDIESGDFPLHEGAHIVHGNALHLDWNDVLPSVSCSYVMGNPPFVGHNMQSHEQEEDLRSVFPAKALISKLDYVTAWFYKAMSYMKGHLCRAAFVATNSICQGEQVHKLWGPMFDLGAHIDFAHRTFKWDSEASDKANVYVVVVGFGEGQSEGKPVLFEYQDINGEPSRREVDNINAYLISGPNLFVGTRREQVSRYPKMAIGTRPVDGGFYILDDDEHEEFVKAEPESAPYFRKFVGAKEFISRTYRWILILGSISCEELNEMPLCKSRVESVREYRLKSTKAATRKRAETPTRFEIENMPTGNYLLLPSVSSQRRVYMPIGFVSPDVVPSSLVLVLPDASLYLFGVLTSQFHNAWMRVVAGRLKADYRYGGDLVYNTFVFPSPNETQREAVEIAAQGVLDARDAHPDLSLAKLYDPDLMPSDLLTAHKALDAAVERAYGVEFNGDEELIVAHLFKLYGELSS